MDCIRKELASIRWSLARLTEVSHEGYQRIAHPEYQTQTRFPSSLEIVHLWSEGYGLLLTTTARMLSLDYQKSSSIFLQLSIDPSP